MAYINPYRMFQGIFIPNGVLRLRDLSQSAKLMLGRLFQYAGKDGKCYPSIEKLSLEIGIKVRQGKAVIGELETYGLIEVVRPTGRDKLLHKCNSYFFIDHPCYHDPVPNKPTNEIPPSEGDKQCTSGSAKNCTSEPAANRPSLEVQKTAPEENHIRESYKKKSKNAAHVSDAVFWADSEQAKEEQSTPPQKTNPEDLSLSEKIFQTILTINPTVKRPNMDKWADVIRLMRERDKRSHAEIWRVFEFANKDQFWRQNCLSPVSLRRNYSKIAGKFLDSGGTLQPPPTKQAAYVCKDCAFMPMDRDICAGKGKAAPHADACNLFRHIDPEIDAKLQAHISRLCA